jgi:DNA repair protein RadC
MLECFLSNFAGRRTRRLVHELLSRFGSLAGVIAAPMQELLLVGRLGITAAVALKVVHTAARRLERAEVIGRPVLDNWSRLMDYLHAELSRERVEQLRVLYLNNRNCLIADEVQQYGTVDSVTVYPREVVKRALELSATALILVHNHPSGDPAPSHDDIEMTDRIRAAVAILSITLHDHIIVGNGCTVSFREQGLLGQPGESGDYPAASSVPHFGFCRQPAKAPATEARAGADSGRSPVKARAARIRPVP